MCLIFRHCRVKLQTFPVGFRCRLKPHPMIYFINVVEFFDKTFCDQGLHLFDRKYGFDVRNIFVGLLIFRLVLMTFQAEILYHTMHFEI